MAKMLWDLECGACGFLNEDVLCTNFDIEQKRLACTNCGDNDLFKQVTAPNIFGARMDKPIVMPNIGKTFTSQRELQKYEKQTGTYAATPSETKAYVDRKLTKLDDMARTKGHKSVEDYKNKIRERKADRESVGKRIIST